MQKLSRKTIVLTERDYFGTYVPDEEEVPSVEVVLGPEVWQEFGKPLTITVTIEPGDKLNEDVQFDEDGNIVGTSG